METSLAEEIREVTGYTPWTEPKPGSSRVVQGLKHLTKGKGRRGRGVEEVNNDN